MKYIVYIEGHEPQVIEATGQLPAVEAYTRKLDRLVLNERLTAYVCNLEQGEPMITYPIMVKTSMIVIGCDNCTNWSIRDNICKYGHDATRNLSKACSKWEERKELP
jgi:hypothetical protein